MTSRKTSSAMKVNKKQKQITNQSNRGKGLQPTKRNVVRNSSRMTTPRKSYAAAYSTGLKGRAPKVVASGDSCRVVHSELIGNVTGSASFTIPSTFALNPGVATTFPWLSNIAQNWETYRFNSLRFCYYTRTGTNIPGSIMMVPDYDAADAAPLGESIASNYEDYIEGPPYMDFSCVLRPSAMHSLGPMKFVRTEAILPNQDIKTFDVGNLFVITLDGTAVSWGKLRVEYDITFHTPQLPPSGSSFKNLAVVQGFDALGLSSVNILGATPKIGGGILTASTPLVVTFTNLVPGGRYFCSSSITGTVITAFNAVIANAGGVAVTSCFTGFNTGATQANVTQTWSVSPSNLPPQNILTITLSATATSVTASEVLVELIPLGFY